MRLALVHNAKGTLPPDGAIPAELTEEEFFAECDSPRTIAAMTAALESGGHEVTPLDADGDLYERLRTGAFDLVFNIAEGLRGEAREAQVPAMLEFLAIPYTGSGPIALALAHDKARAKEVWRAHGLPTARGVVVPTGAGVGELPPSRAWIVKPVAEGSSKGVRNSSVARTRAEVAARVEETHRTFRQPALVEEFLQGREFTVAILGAPPRALPIVEVDFSSLPAGAERLYSYEAKWIWDVPEKPLAIFRCPAALESSLSDRIGALALAAFESLGCRDWGRVDLRLDEAGEPRLLEINPLPGILPDPKDNSCFPKAARAAGLTYERALLAVVESARRRCSNPERAPATR